MRYLKLLLPMMFLAGCMKEVELPSSGSLEGGNWYVSCVYKDSTYQTRITSFEGGSYTHTSAHYTDSSCTQKGLELGEVGTYTIGAQIPSSSRYPLDRKLSALTITPYSASVVANYNSSTLCGFSDWAVGVTKNVTGLNCGSGVLPTAGTMYYDVYLIWPYDIPAAPGYPGTGVTAGTLNFGYTDSTYDGTTPAKRPTSVTSPDYHR